MTLEPCSHFGKSPPCADAVIAAGIARVVSAIEDPNPEVAGQGHARLRAAGITVDVGLCAAEAARDHAGHFRRIRDKRPHVILKLAVSADDKIGAAGRKPVAITGEAAKARVHLLRAQCDAILVGIGTVLADDPLLTCRLPGMEARSPVRVVLDRALRIPGTSRLVHSARETPLWVMTSDLAEAPAAMKLGAAGAQVIRVAGRDNAAGARSGRRAACASEKGITRLMVEGGARVASSFVAAGLVDEIWLLRGAEPVGADGVAALDALPLSAITRSPAFKLRASETLGRTIPHDLRARVMFTGIVTDIGEIVSLTPTAQGQLHRLRIACRYDRATIADGASIACNGVCLTVVASGVEGGKTWFDVDAAAETLGMTTAKHWATRHTTQSRARAEDRRRTRRPYRRRTCRRHRHHRQARRSARHGAV